MTKKGKGVMEISNSRGMAEQTSPSRKTMQLQDHFQEQVVHYTGEWLMTKSEQSRHKMTFTR